MHSMIHATHVLRIWLLHSISQLRRNQENSRSHSTRCIFEQHITNIPKPSCQLRPGCDNEIALWTCRSKSCTKRYPAKVEAAKRKEIRNEWTNITNRNSSPRCSWAAVARRRRWHHCSCGPHKAGPAPSAAKGPPCGERLILCSSNFGSRIDSEHVTPPLSRGTKDEGSRK